MNILLTTLNAKYIHINLAIRLLYELNADYAGLEWKEFTIREDRDTIAGFCTAYDVVAFSCYIWNISPTLEVARRIKAANPAVRILLGGPEVSYDWEDVIAREEVDYIITGEGEIPFREFLRHYPDVAAVPNLVWKTAGEVRYLPASAVFDLAEYLHIMPYRRDPPEEIRNRVMYVETSRGCPYKCEFCLASLDNKMRYLPAENRNANLLYLMEHGRVIKFLDRTFNIKRDFTLDIFRFILEHHRPQNVFQFEITADILHPDLVEFIHLHVPKGLFRFEIGIQTVNQKANLEVSRKQDFEKTKAIIHALSDKVEMHLDLIVGLPLDYWDDIRYSFEEVFKLFAPELQMGFLKFLKGTPVRQKYAQHGFVFDPEPPYQIVESNYLSRGELHRLTLVEHMLEIYWNKKRTLRTLRYVTGRYSVFDFLEALGAYFQSRSDLHHYTQKDTFVIIGAFIEQYYEADTVLKEMLAVDYYLCHKTKPGVIFLKESEKQEKQRLLEELGLNSQKYRYLLFNLSFDLPKFETEGIVDHKPFTLLLQYQGTEMPVRIELEKTMHE